jgi:hypothetical protein
MNFVSFDGYRYHVYNTVVSGVRRFGSIRNLFRKNGGFDKVVPWANDLSSAEKYVNIPDNESGLYAIYL